MIQWRFNGRNGKLVARIISPLQLTPIVIHTGQTQPRVVSQDRLLARVVVESENMMIAGGG